MNVASDAATGDGDGDDGDAKIETVRLDSSTMQQTFVANAVYDHTFHLLVDWFCDDNFFDFCNFLANCTCRTA